MTPTATIRILALLALCTLAACKGTSNKTEEKPNGNKTEETAKTNETASTEGNSVCVWDGVAVWTAPEVKERKWVASLPMGQKVSYAGKTEEIKVDKVTIPMHQVKLSDGKEGWVDGRMVIANAKAAAITHKITIYSRPELIAKTDNSFEPFDIVGIVAEKGEWVQVTGKRREGKWIETAWVKNNGLSQEEKDIAVGLFGNRALAIKDTKKRKEAIQKIVDDADLAGSAFANELTRILSDLSDGESDSYITPLDTTGAK